MQHLRHWVAVNKHHEIEILASKAELRGGELLFLISCQEIIREKTKALYQKTVVIHASDVPKGKGFAPLNWQILEQKSQITVTMMDAAEAVDSGDVYRQINFNNEGHETHEEIFEKLFHAEIELMDYAVANFPNLRGTPQDPSIESTYYRKRTPQDSRVSVDDSLESIFDLLRASDPTRYPVTFEHRGHVYSIRLEKLSVQKLAPQAVVHDLAPAIVTSGRS